MKRSTTRLVLSCFLLAIIPACKKPAPAAPPQPPEVGVAAVVERDVPITVDMVGQTLGAADVEIRSRTLGWVLGIHFKEGTEVKKGTLLYTIDSSELKERVASAEGNVASAKTMLAQADNDVKRYTPLVEMKAVSQRDLDLAVAQQGAAKGALEAAEAALALARINLGYANVVAPIDGLIGISKVKVGDYVGVGPASQLDTISRIDPIHVRVSISEREYLDIARRLALAGDKAQDVRHGLDLYLSDGSLHPHKGEINFADRQVDPSTGSLLVDASFPNPEKLLKPGQFARVRAVAETRKGALLVPQRAVQELQGNYFVYTVGADSKAMVQPIKTGVRVGELWLIEDGLKTSDRVVVDGVQRVRAGEAVTVKPMSAAAEGGGAAPEGEKKSAGAGH